MTEWTNEPPSVPKDGKWLKKHNFRIANFVVGTAVGSAKGLFGKDLAAEQEVFVLDAPLDREGKAVI